MLLSGKCLIHDYNIKIYFSRMKNRDGETTIATTTRVRDRGNRKSSSIRFVCG